MASVGLGPPAEISMDVTGKLLKLFRIDMQLRGLQSRLVAAERFLAEQDKILQQHDAKKTQLDAQLKQLTAVARDQEGESKRLDARMEALRQQMNAAQTNKEYKAFLTEFNTIKAERDRAETAALEAMAKLDELKKQAADLDSQRAEREKVRGVAATDRDARAAEISGRVSELKTQRVAAAADIPAETLTMFEQLLAKKGEEAMAAIEELDRKRYEFTCGACQRAITMDAVSGLIAGGKLTRCTACGCVLYVEKELAESMVPVKK